MLDPCFTAMLDGAVMATNPPTGLTAVPQDGSNASSQINAIFAALPHANTNSRNVYFSRPSARYKIDARLDITVDGTTVLCGGQAKITLKNTTSNSRDTEDLWFRGSALTPHVRMDNVEHVHWHGGGLQGRESQSVSDGNQNQKQTAFEMGTTRFCVVSNFYVKFCENMAQINGLASGEWCEHCVIRDSHWWQGWDIRPTFRLGTNNIRATSGKVRNCGSRNFWISGGSNGPTADEALDCFSYGGYSEGHGGGAAYVGLSGSLRFIWIGTNVENSEAQDIQSGASFTSIGHAAWGSGGGDFYVFGF